MVLNIHKAMIDVKDHIRRNFFKSQARGEPEVKGSSFSFDITNHVDLNKFLLKL